MNAQLFSFLHSSAQESKIEKKKTSGSFKNHAIRQTLKAYNSNAYLKIHLQKLLILFQDLRIDNSISVKRHLNRCQIIHTYLKIQKIKLYNSQNEKRFIQDQISEKFNKKICIVSPFHPLSNNKN